MRSGQKGTAVIEMAFLMGFLLLLAVGITEFGRALWYYSALQKAAREGARCLSVTAWSTTASADADSCLAIVRTDANSAGVYPQVVSAEVEMRCDDETCSSATWGLGTAPEYVGIHVQHSMRWIWRIGETLPAPGQNTTFQVNATMPLMD